MKICVVGLGYIGLPTAAMLASRGHSVIGYDVNPNVIAAVNAGQAHFFEPDLDMLLSAAVRTGSLRASLRPEVADYFVIAVPTPVRPGGAPDMTFVENAARSIAPALRKGATVILESTSPVGSTEMIASILAEERPDLAFPAYKQSGNDADVSVCHCPERILPGQMLKELVSNDRVIGGLTETCSQKALDLYADFVVGNCYLTDSRAAELVKLSENAFRDVNIAFANELSMVCDRLGVDIWQVRELANKHPRVQILEPGAGVGGHCIAVDPWFIVHSAPQEARLIRTARIVNDDKPQRLIAEIKLKAGRFKTPTIACYGITYKADVDDTRESPALRIVSALADDPALSILVSEPTLAALPDSLASRPNVTAAHPDEAHKTADVVVFLVGHRVFKTLNPDVFLDKVVVDPIGLISRSAVAP